MYEVLARLGEELNRAGVTWAVGGSLLLDQCRLADRTQDIDLLVSVEYIATVVHLLDNMGCRHPEKPNEGYSTRFFYEYTIEGVEVDVMSGLALNHEAGIFRCPFDKRSVSIVRRIRGTEIPFSSLEDWYVIYQLIPGREEKVKRIEDYLFANKSLDLFLLERALEKELPVKIRRRTEAFLPGTAQHSVE